MGLWITVDNYLCAEKYFLMKSILLINNPSEIGAGTRG
ncbi:MAG: hypothetical protein ACI898_000842, partial [Flavobacteriales bacterium]